MLSEERELFENALVKFVSNEFVLTKDLVYLLTTLQLISFSIYIWETGSECPFGQATSTLWPRGNIMMDLDTHKCLDEPLILLCPAWLVLYSMANRMKKVVQFQEE